MKAFSQKSLAALLLLVILFFCGCNSQPATGSLKLKIDGNAYTALPVEAIDDPALYDNELVVIGCTQDELKTCRLFVDGIHLENNVTFTVFDENAKHAIQTGKEFSLPNEEGIYYVCIGIDWGTEDNFLHTDNLFKFHLTNS